MENIHTLKAAISPTGKLMVIYSGQVMGESGLLQEALFFTQRTLDLPTASLQSQTTPTPLPTVLPTPTVTSTPQPAPTLDLANLGSISTSSNIILLNTKWSALAIGAILALLIVSSAVGYRVLASKFKTR